MNEPPQSKLKFSSKWMKGSKEDDADSNASRTKAKHARLLQHQNEEILSIWISRSQRGGFSLLNIGLIFRLLHSWCFLSKTSGENELLSAKFEGDRGAATATILPVCLFLVGHWIILKGNVQCVSSLEVRILNFLIVTPSKFLVLL